MLISTTSPQRRFNELQQRYLETLTSLHDAELIITELSDEKDSLVTSTSSLQYEIKTVRSELEELSLILESYESRLEETKIESVSLRSTNVAIRIQLEGFSNVIFRENSGYFANF